MKVRMLLFLVPALLTAGYTTVASGSGPAGGTYEVSTTGDSNSDNRYLSITGIGVSQGGHPKPTLQAPTVVMVDGDVLVPGVDYDVHNANEKTITIEFNPPHVPSEGVTVHVHGHTLFDHACANGDPEEVDDLNESWSDGVPP